MNTYEIIRNGLFNTSKKVDNIDKAIKVAEKMMSNKTTRFVVIQKSINGDYINSVVLATLRN